MNKTLTNKILITLAFLFAYKILTYVPVPGVNVNVIKEFFDSNSANALGLFNMFSGKAAERLSIISLGIMLYITASIIMELLAATFPNLGKMKKDRDGMQKYCRSSAMPLSVSRLFKQWALVWDFRAFTVEAERTR